MAEEVELKVSWHPSGNRTLMRRPKGKDMWTDYPTGSDLLANPDMAKFYRATAQAIATLNDEGFAVKYLDAPQ